MALLGISSVTQIGAKEIQFNEFLFQKQALWKTLYYLNLIKNFVDTLPDIPGHTACSKGDANLKL